MPVDQGELKVLMRDALEDLASNKAALAVRAIILDLHSRLDSWTEEPFDKKGKVTGRFNLDDENMQEFWIAIIEEAFKK